MSPDAPVLCLASMYCRAASWSRVVPDLTGGALKTVLVESVAADCRHLPLSRRRFRVTIRVLW
jgi:hypothetical protein